MDTIFNRASVRSFRDEGVSDNDIEMLLRAAMAAPSAMNQQPWEFYVTQDPATCQVLSAASPYAKPAEGAPVVIIPCCRKEGNAVPIRVAQDMSAAVENILLEAVELGLGTVWMGIHPDPDRMGHVTQTLGIPESLEPFAMIAVGYPAELPRPQGALRYDPKRVHWV